MSDGSFPIFLFSPHKAGILFEGISWTMQRQTYGLSTAVLKTFECFPNIPNSKEVFHNPVVSWSRKSSKRCSWAVAISISLPRRYGVRGFVNKKINFKTCRPRWNWKSSTAINRPLAWTQHCFKASRILKIWLSIDFTASKWQVQCVAQNDFSSVYFPDLSLSVKLFKIASFFGEWKKWCKDWTIPSAFLNIVFASRVSWKS